MLEYQFSEIPDIFQIQSTIQLLIVRYQQKDTPHESLRIVHKLNGESTLSD